MEAVSHIYRRLLIVPRCTKSRGNVDVTHVKVDCVFKVCALYTDDEGQERVADVGNEAARRCRTSRHQTAVNAKPQLSRVTSVEPEIEHEKLEYIAQETELVLRCRLAKGKNILFP